MPATGLRAERQRANSRAALVEAAYEEFAANGYEATTVSGIAARAGVTSGAVYAHFSGKLELLLETVGLAPVEDLVRAFGDAASLPWSQAIRRLSVEMASEPDDRTLLLLDVIVAARRNPALAKILNEGLKNYLEGSEAAVRSGMAAGLVDPALAPADLTRMLALISLGMIIFTALGEKGPSTGAFELVADLLLQSSGTPGGEPPALARLRARSLAARQAKDLQVEAMVDAAAAGYSLRQIGAAAELSHERVRQLLRGAGE